MIDLYQYRLSFRKQAAIETLKYVDAFKLDSVPHEIHCQQNMK